MHLVGMDGTDCPLTNLRDVAEKTVDYLLVAQLVDAVMHQLWNAKNGGAEMLRTEIKGIGTDTMRDLRRHVRCRCCRRSAPAG
jgi:hypothetical protein